MQIVFVFIVLAMIVFGAFKSCGSSKPENRVGSDESHSRLVAQPSNTPPVVQPTQVPALTSPSLSLAERASPVMDPLANLLKPTSERVGELGYVDDKFVNDFKVGVLCRQSPGTLAFYFDLQKSLTMLFDQGSGAVIYRFPGKIIAESTSTGGVRYFSSSRRADLSYYYTFEVTAPPEATRAIGVLTLSRQPPPGETDARFPFQCGE